MTLQDLKDLFLRKNVSIQRIRPSKHIGSKAGFYHTINPTYSPPKSEMTPKKWEEQQKAYKKSLAAKTKKNLNYECPDCKKPMNKLDWCEIDRRWAVLKENK